MSLLLPSSGLHELIRYRLVYPPIEQDLSAVQETDNDAGTEVAEKDATEKAA